MRSRIPTSPFSLRTASSGAESVTPKRNYTKVTILTVVVTLVVATSGAIVSQQLFNAPPLNAPRITTSCAALKPESSALVANSGAVSVVVGTSGSIRFRCRGEAQAITSNGKGMVIPSFALPPPYTSLALVAKNPQLVDCSTNEGIVLLTGTPVSLPTGNYDYCASFVNASSNGLPQFTVTWSQQ